MGEFHCNFLDWATNNSSDPEKYKDHFLNYDPQKWLAGSGGGAFTYRDDEFADCTIIALENPKYGIMFMYNLRRKGDKKGEGWLTVGNVELINQIEDVGDDQFFPLGSFVTPEEAWLALEDFFKHPTEKPKRVKWVNVDDVEWPEDC